VNGREVDFGELLAGLSGELPALRDGLLTHARGDLGAVELPPGGVLLRQGEVAHAMYVVAKGRLRATLVQDDASELELSQFGPGELAGEIAILSHGDLHSATVSAITDALLVSVSREAFDRVVAAEPGVVREMAAGIRRRLARDQLAVGLRRLFGAVDDAMLRYVESRVEWKRLRAGEVLFSAGERSEDLYFVVGGRLRALAPDGTALGEMTRGESIGEIALLTGESRTATVTAVRDSELVHVTRHAFDDIVAKYPQAMQAIARIVVRRLLAKERHEPGTRAKCIAVMPAGPGTRIDEFCRSLAKALEPLGATLHLSSERFGGLLSRRGFAGIDEEEAAGIRLTTWLDAQESHYRFLLYETDAGPSAWSRRCLRQADDLILVAPAGASPVPGELERTLLDTSEAGSRARRTLVLLHPDDGRLPSATSGWFEGRDVQQHFHVRLGRDGDYRRLARCIAGMAIGLVLGGGGARGLAHIGVVRALREANIPIDKIGGTSMGAVIASLVAMDYDWKQMVEVNRDAWMKRKPHTEYALPLVSLVRSRRLDSMAQHVWGDTNIEDLWLDYFCISCNLSTSETVVHERGTLWKAVRASASIPGVFVPVLDNGDALVDGGIVNNLPGDIMRERSCHRVIVVDVGSEHDFLFNVSEVPSPWKLLLNRITPFAKRLEAPLIGEVLLRVTDVASSYRTHEVRRAADLALRPPIDRYGVLQFEMLDEIVDVGYRYMSEKLAQLGDDVSVESLVASVASSR